MDASPARGELSVACVVCRHRSRLPGAQGDVLLKEGIRTLCHSCDAVRMHTILPAPPAEGAAGTDDEVRRQMIAAAEARGFNRARLQDLTSPDRRRLFEVLGFTPALTTRLSGTLADALSEEPPRRSVSRSGTPSRTALSLPQPSVRGASPASAAPDRVSTRDIMPSEPWRGHSVQSAQRSFVPSPAHALSPAGGGLEHRTPPGAPPRQLPQGHQPAPPVGLVPSAAPASSLSRGVAPVSQATASAAAAPPTASAVPGLSFTPEDGVIARCSVYPHLPAEFWCCQCGVLVSSRCHVQGVHKDHPFVALRMAAESHVRDVTAWNERCRGQLDVLRTVLGTLRHADEALVAAQRQEHAALDEAVEAMVADLRRWQGQLRADMDAQVAAQQGSIAHAVGATERLHATYADALSRAEPLMQAVPPVDATGRVGDEWALRVLDLASKLRNVGAEPVPLPRVTIPRVACTATAATHMELLRCVPTPLGVRLPDVLDPGYFNFPTPAAGAKLPFTLTPPDARGDGPESGGVLVYNGRTLTRAVDAAAAHQLVLGSQTFYTGAAAWEVHLDRVGAGTGRVLAGVTVGGSEGEGVVWDGLRIVGPNEGEVRAVDERFAWRAGTVLRFHLELDAPACFLNCFHDREGVARVPLPPNTQGWVPTFSVLGHDDQITVVPSGTSAQAAAAESALPPTSPLTALPTSPTRTAAEVVGDTASVMQRQDAMIAALQDQVHSLSQRLENEAFARRADAASLSRPQPYPPHSALVPEPQPHRAAGRVVPPPAGPPPPSSSAPPAAPPGATPVTSLAFPAPSVVEAHPQTPHRPQGPAPAAEPPALPAAPDAAVRSASEASGAVGAPPAYSPELRQLMRFVNQIN